MNKVTLIFRLKSNKGSTILVALAVLSVLAVSAMAFRMTASHGLRNEIRSYHQQQARYLALTGLEYCLAKLGATESGYVENVADFPNKDLVNKTFQNGYFEITGADEYGYPFGVIDQNMKLNFNLLSRSQLRRLNIFREEDLDALLRYREQRPFQDLAEVKMIPEIKDFVPERTARLRKYCTVFGNTGVNINKAPAEVLSLATGLPLTTTRQIVEARTPSAENQAGTNFKSVQEFAEQYPEAEINGLAIESTTFMFVSKGVYTGGQFELVEWMYAVAKKENKRIKVLRIGRL